MTPDGTAQFNVAIRTAVIDRAAGTARYGVGSGIVWDSDPAAEYAECLLKARVLAPDDDMPGSFSLLESLRWTPEEGYWLLERHLDRLGDRPNTLISRSTGRRRGINSLLWRPT
ncbi:MAG: chorismate-binding protein [Chloroflexota bacterium]